MVKPLLELLSKGLEFLVLFFSNPFVQDFPKPPAAVAHLFLLTRTWSNWLRMQLMSSRIACLSLYLQSVTTCWFSPLATSSFVKHLATLPVKKSETIETMTGEAVASKLDVQAPPFWSR